MLMLLQIFNICFTCTPLANIRAPVGAPEIYHFLQYHRIASWSNECLKLAFFQLFVPRLQDLGIISWSNKRQLGTSSCSAWVSSPLSLLNTSSGRLYMSKVDEEERGSDISLKWEERGSDMFKISSKFSKCNLMLSPRQLRMDWMILKMRHNDKRKGNCHFRFSNCSREDRDTEI